MLEKMKKQNSVEKERTNNKDLRYKKKESYFCINMAITSFSFLSTILATGIMTVPCCLVTGFVQCCKYFGTTTLQLKMYRMALIP